MPPSVINELVLGFCDGVSEILALEFNPKFNMTMGGGGCVGCGVASSPATDCMEGILFRMNGLTLVNSTAVPALLRTVCDWLLSNRRAESFEARNSSSLGSLRSPDVAESNDSPLTWATLDATANDATATAAVVVALAAALNEIALLGLRLPQLLLTAAEAAAAAVVAAVADTCDIWSLVSTGDQTPNNTVKNRTSTMSKVPNWLAEFMFMLPVSGMLLKHWAALTGFKLPPPPVARLVCIFCSC